MFRWRFENPRSLFGGSLTTLWPLYLHQDKEHVVKNCNSSFLFTMQRILTYAWFIDYYQEFSSHRYWISHLRTNKKSYKLLVVFPHRYWISLEDEYMKSYKLLVVFSNRYWISLENECVKSYKCLVRIQLQNCQKVLLKGVLRRHHKWETLLLNKNLRIM